MAGRSSTISHTEPKLGGIQVQTSLYGLAVPRFWGRVRIGGNLLWYGDFKATPITDVSESGGKGGGGVRQESTRWSYSAAVALGLGAGPVNGIVSAWKGKERISGASAAQRTRTLSHQATVPVGGSVTVPSAASFTRNVAVRAVSYLQSGDSPDERMAAGVLIEGQAYTQSAGVYSFVPAWEGGLVLIEYQILESVAATSALGQLGLNLATGTLGQATWSHLATNHPGQAIGYSGLAYLYAAAYPLNDSAQVENHNFEISTPSEFSSTIPDANMARVVQEFMTDGLHGCQWPSARLGDLSAYSDYCVSHGLFMSPELTEQRPAAEILRDWLRLTNSNAVWSALKLKIVPLGDEAKTANGATFTPDTTPVYDLQPGDFVHESGQRRVKVTPRANEDVFNIVRVEFKNRANDYAVEIAEARDLAHIEQYGQRVKEVIKAHEVKTADVAGFVAQIALQRELAVVNDYAFTLPWTKARLEPLDLVTLTDPDVYLDRAPVRITKVSEAGDDAFDIEAEDAPIGMASAPRYGTQAGSGFKPDFNADPGDVDAPVIFELPTQLATDTGLQVAVAVRGSGANWGGCQVWVSLDGTSYRQLGAVYGPARYGTLASSVVSTAAVQGLGAAQLLNGSATDAAALQTLCYVGGASPEYLAYETATLTGAGAYTLAGLVRGAYGTPVVTHAAGDAFVRVDERIVRSEPLERGLIGSTLHFKFTSFNPYGGSTQSLADVSDYTYVVTGDLVKTELGDLATRDTVGTAQIDTEAATEVEISNLTSDNWTIAGPTPIRALMPTSFTNTLAEPVWVEATGYATRRLTAAAGSTVLGAATHITYSVNGGPATGAPGFNVADGATPGSPLTWSDSVGLSLLVAPGDTITVYLTAAITGVFGAGSTLETANGHVRVTAIKR